jgi:hypothetical protein
VVGGLNHGCEIVSLLDNNIARCSNASCVPKPTKIKNKKKYKTTTTCWSLTTTSTFFLQIQQHAIKVGEIVRLVTWSPFQLRACTGENNDGMQLGHDTIDDDDV